MWGTQSEVNSFMRLRPAILTVTEKHNSILLCCKQQISSSNISQLVADLHKSLRTKKNIYIENTVAMQERYEKIRNGRNP